MVGAKGSSWVEHLGGQWACVTAVQLAVYWVATWVAQLVA